MAYNQYQFTSDYTDEEFYAVIDRLKLQKALPSDSFIRNIPFFKFGFMPKEAQLKELFQEPCDPDVYRALLQNIAPVVTDVSDDTKPSIGHIMTFAQVCLYKVLPCPDPNCANRPREIVTHNQYKDHEYECPFYHHERDRRRIVITSTVDEEFVYKANYYEEGRSHAEKEKYSQNYFESMFHPLYYKMFRCKREYCNESRSCPFYHYEQEKKTWDKVFSSFIRKDRITYVKDKQKYYESTSHASEVREPKSSGDFSPNKLYGQEYPQRSYRNKYPRSPQTPNQNTNPNFQGQNEGRLVKSRQYQNRKGKGDAWRKDSGDSLNGWNSNNIEFFDANRQFVPYRVC